MNTFRLLTSKVRRLSHIRRYSSIQVIRPENVAEHSFYCSLIAFAIATDARLNNVRSVNPERTAVRAMCHDLEESMTGDILRSFKYSSEELRACIEEAGRNRMRALSKDFGLAEGNVAWAWRHAKDGDEGEIVALADLLCVVAYVREERLAGNQHLNDVATEVHGYIGERFGPDHWLHRYVADLYPNNDPNDIFREVSW